MTGDNPFMNWDIPMTNQRIYKYAMIMGGGNEELESYVSIQFFKTLKEGIRFFITIWEDFENLLDDLDDEDRIDAHIGENVSLDGLIITNKPTWRYSKSTIARLPNMGPIIQKLKSITNETWEDYQKGWDYEVNRLKLEDYEKKLDLIYSENGFYSDNRGTFAWWGIMELKLHKHYSGSTWRLVRIP